jgi:hypothetical protein
MLSTKKIGCFILSHQITLMAEIFKKTSGNFKKIAGDLDPYYPSLFRLEGKRSSQKYKLLHSSCGLLGRN